MENHLFIGGAVSIDRVPRRMDTRSESWWKDEVVNFDFERVKEFRDIDRVICHTAPDFCQPLKFNQLVLNKLLDIVSSPTLNLDKTIAELKADKDVDYQKFGIHGSYHLGYYVIIYTLYKTDTSRMKFLSCYAHDYACISCIINDENINKPIEELREIVKPLLLEYFHNNKNKKNNINNYIKNINKLSHLQLLELFQILTVKYKLNLNNYILRLNTEVIRNYIKNQIKDLSQQLFYRIVQKKNKH